MRASFATLAFAMASALALPAGTTRAGAVITFEQVGNDVVATASGSLDLSGLGAPTDDFVQPGLVASIGYLVLSQQTTPNAPDEVFSGATGPSSFGSGGFFAPSFGTGDTVGVVSGDIHVPVGYVSGTPLSASDTFAGQTFTTLGLTPGTYTYTWSTDSLTIQIGAASVPEPSSLAMGSCAALAGLMVWMRRRRAA
jgi:hypothetical protein